MATLAEIFVWFMTGKKPTQAQFWASFSSFWHKLEQIPISAIAGLTAVLNAKAEKVQFDAHKIDLNAHADLFESKLDSGGFSGTAKEIVDAVAFKASPAFTGTPTAPTAPIGTSTSQLATTEFVLGNSGVFKSLPAVSFSFDDSFVSQYALAAAFELRGVRFSQGTTISYIGGTGAMTLIQIKDLQNRGFEVLNHTATHKDMRDSSSATYDEAYSEIKGAHDSLLSMGLNPKGFVSPFSTVKREFLPIIDNLYTSAYTIRFGAGAGAIDPDIQVMNVPIHSTRMNRASLYEHTVAECKAIIDKAFQTNGVVNFYDHDPGGVYNPTSATVANILAVLDYAISVVGVKNIIKASEIPSRFNAVLNAGGVYTAISSGLAVLDKTFTTATLQFAVESKDIKALTDGTFYIKTSGIYMFDVACTYTITTVTRTLIAIEIDNSGVYRNRHNGFGSIGYSTSQTYNSMTFPALTLVKGQVVKIKLFQDSGVKNVVPGSEAYDFIKVIKLSN